MYKVSIIHSRYISVNVVFYFHEAEAYSCGSVVLVSVWPQSVELGTSQIAVGVSKTDSKAISEQNIKEGCLFNVGFLVISCFNTLLMASIQSGLHHRILAHC